MPVCSPLEIGITDFLTDFPLKQNVWCARHQISYLRFSLWRQEITNMLLTFKPDHLIFLFFVPRMIFLLTLLLEQKFLYDFTSKHDQDE